MCIRDSADTSVTFAAVWEDSIESCSGCHDAVSPSGRLDLSSQDVAYTNLMDGYVTPGAADSSSLYDRVTRSGMGRMPPSPSSPLSSDQVDLIEAWIVDGAVP